jgi:AcrR family transcriptional regulator
MLRAMRPGRDGQQAVAAVESASLRKQQAQLTRELILRAVVDLLREEDPGDVTVPAVAERSGVSLRTVYRHFPHRDELFSAAADWINEQVFGGIPYEESANELGQVFRQACERFDAEPGLVRAMALSDAGRRVRAHRRALRLAGIRQAIAEVAGYLPAAEIRRGEAVIGYLENMLAWVTMREETDLDGKEIGEAVAWAIETLVADLRRRNAVAAKPRKETR